MTTKGHTMTTAPSLPTVVRSIATEAAKLAALVATVEDAQWQPSTTPRPREDTTERSKGGHSDPTVNIVADTARLVLREAVEAASARLTETVRVLAANRAALETAIDKWHGV